MLEINTIHNMDCLEGLKKLKENSIDAVVTDPPYGLSFMGKKWDYDVPKVKIWQECLRVLKPGGMLLSFAGTRTQHRIACVIEEAGFEIRDMIAWVYGSGFPKSLNVGKAIDKLQGNKREILGKYDPRSSQDGCVRQDRPIGNQQVAPSKTSKLVLSKGTSEWEGWGTALKPAFEPITVARKPLSEKTVAENVLKWGTGGIYVDECRVGNDLIPCSNDIRSLQKWKELDGRKHKELINPAPSFNQGRFPANFIHDGSKEVLKGFPETANSNPTKRKRKVFGSFGMPNDNTPEYSDKGTASRFFYCAKASKSERNYGCEEMPLKHYLKDNKMGGEKDTMLTGSGNPRDCRKHNYHPTVKPLKLMEYLIKLVSKKNAIILDPFMGSGTTAIACIKQQRHFIGFEMEKEYCKIANARINKAREQTKLDFF